MDKAALARRNFEEGYNCCQSVVLAFAPETGLSADTAALLAAGLGGGVSRLREVCGAVSGAAVVLGMLHGSVNPLDQEAKTALYAVVQELAVEFERRNGSYICRDLLGLPPGRDDPAPSARTPQYYQKRRCGELIASMAALLEKHLAEEKNPASPEENG